jgi:hypothetical protein
MGDAGLRDEFWARWRAYDRDELDLAGATASLRDPAQWHAFVDALFQTDWVVYAKPAFGGATAVLGYLGRSLAGRIRSGLG